MYISLAEYSDIDSLAALFPRLASFSVPDRRNPKHLWEGDYELLLEWTRGDSPHCLVNVAKDDDGNVLGMTMVTLREELLSHSPSAHLEVLVVAAEAEGCGVGGALLAAAESSAREHGARSMSLHVFARNERARAIYERAGYDGELLRYIKPFDDDALR